MQFFAERQQASLWADVEIDAVPFRTTDGTEQHRIGLFRPLKCGIGQGHAMGVDGNTTDQILDHLKTGAAGGVQPVDYTTDLTHDFGADAVTGEKQDRFGHGGCSLENCQR